MRPQRARGLVALAALVALAVLPALMRDIQRWVVAPAPSEDARWGIIDSSGEYVRPVYFSGANGDGFAPNGLAAAKDAKTHLWGYVWKGGTWAIEPRFSQARAFSVVGLAAAQGRRGEAQWGKWGYIDESGAWAIEPQYDVPGVFYGDGMASVRVGDDRLWIDEGGNVVDGPSDEDEKPRAEWDEATGLDGIRSPDGTWLVEPSFSQLRSREYSDLLMAYPAEGFRSCGIVNRSGEWLLSPIYKNLVIPADGDEAVAVRDADSGLCGYVRWDGAWAIEPRFADATRMGPDGYALAEAVLR